MTNTRRQFLQTLGAGAVASRLPAAEENRFRLAICNETFDGWNFRDACAGAIRFGYTGLEISPFTLAEDPSTVTPQRRKALKHIMASEGVEYVGLHNLMKAPAGLHLTTPDAGLRNRSWELFAKLVDLAADLGDDPLMIFGSSKQRDAKRVGATVADAKKRLVEGFVSIAPHAEQRGVKILMEPLAPHLCDVVNTLGEAVEIVDQVNSPAVRSMFDTHNAVAETEPHGDVIKKYLPYIQHVHINEMDGRHPTTGSYDFVPVLQALKDVKFQHWVSLEVFKFKPSPEEVARVSERFLRETEAGLT